MPRSYTNEADPLDEVCLDDSEWYARFAGRGSPGRGEVEQLVDELAVAGLHAAARAAVTAGRL